jgi:hypothetical protein
VEPSGVFLFGNPTVSDADAVAAMSRIVAPYGGFARSSRDSDNSLSISLLGNEEFRSSRSESRSETGALSGHQYQSSSQYRESTRARQSSHFAVPSINPRGEFFHVFLSYRVADDEELVKSLYSKLQLDSKTHAIPLLEDSKFPHQFHKDLSNTADAAANVFLSARCLLDGEKWDWDSRSKGGFVGALMQSCVFVPVFSCSIDDCKPGHDPAKIGNIARMATLAQPAHDDVETWISMSEATQGRAAYLCFETASHSKRRMFLEGDVVEFDSYQNFELPTFLSKNKKYFLVQAKDCPRSHNKFQRFLVSELKGGPPLALQACSSKFVTKTFECDWVDNVLLELLLAKEFHLHTKQAENENGISLRRCMTILPVVLCDMSEFRWFINTFLSDKPSSRKRVSNGDHHCLPVNIFVNLLSAAHQCVYRHNCKSCWYLERTANANI